MCLLLFLLRKFLCLGDPLMCLADKASMSSQVECAPVVKANGKYLNCENYLVLLLLLLNVRYNTNTDMKSATHQILFLLFPPGHSTEADTSSGSSVKTLKRTFSLLKSSEPSVGSTIPIHQIISLVSMTSPRTFRPHKVSSSPAFVEFDMSESGYG